jgi:enoyl-CoA hydratase
VGVCVNRIGTYETLQLGRHDSHVLLVTLNRPEASNAMNTQMGRDLMELFEEFQIQFHDLRCIVVTGAGEKAFCAGGDLKKRRGMTDEAWQAQHGPHPYVSARLASQDSAGPD